ncbi:MAG: potassium channel protein [Planctomycetaceae bacterium]|nr:potassium channel protein [Planctomycetales bacterium]MCB9874643.1 potassium channel protein [Planctomycetaceae bacterium]MCB9936933.1 potassium channel protein [Planctomycetaceae bacterium]
MERPAQRQPDPHRLTQVRRGGSTKSPLTRMRNGLIVLGVVFAVAVIGFRILGDYDWVTALWMTAITISSVGFSETTDSPPSLQLFTIGVIVFGMSAAAYTFGGFVQMVLEGELEILLGHRRMTRGIENLSGHVIVCGFGRIGEVLSTDLKHSRRDFVVIDTDSERFEAAKSQGFLCICGDATSDEILLEAGIERAKTLVSALPSDADNVFITLTARTLCPSIQIFSRAEHPTTERKLIQAGASKVIMPAIIGAHQLERLISRPSTAHLIELVSQSDFFDVELDEITLPENCKLVGVTVSATEAHRKHRLLVVAVKQADASMIFNPGAEYVFKAGDIAIVMGRAEDIQRFRDAFELLI